MTDEQINAKALEVYPNLPKIKGWVTKTNEGDTLFHTTTAKPEKGETCWFGNEGDAIIDTESHLFPELTFNDEPIEVELIIRQIK